MMAENDDNWHIGANRGFSSTNYTFGSPGWQGADWRERQDKEAKKRADEADEWRKKAKSLANAAAQRKAESTATNSSFGSHLSGPIYTGVSEPVMPNAVSIGLIVIGAVLCGFKLVPVGLPEFLSFFLILLGIGFLVHRYWMAIKIISAFAVCAIIVYFVLKNKYIIDITHYF
jgi:hypothetical protein